MKKTDNIFWSESKDGILACNSMEQGTFDGRVILISLAGSSFPHQACYKPHAPANHTDLEKRRWDGSAPMADLTDFAQYARKRVRSNR
jgi:hypothetical protein